MALTLAQFNKENAMESGTVYLAVYDTMADWEYGYVMAHLNSKEFQQHPGSITVKTVGRTLEPVTTKGGIRILPDLCLGDLQIKQAKMLILPGGDSAESDGISDFADKAVQCVAEGVPVAAICGATVALAKKGLLDNVPHTSNAAAYLEMTGYQGSAHYRQQPAVSSDLIITAGGVAPIEFAVEIFRKLNVYTQPVLEAWTMLFKDQNLHAFHKLMAESEQ